MSMQFIHNSRIEFHQMKRFFFFLSFIFADKSEMVNFWRMPIIRLIILNLHVF